MVTKKFIFTPTQDSGEMEEGRGKRHPNSVCSVTSINAGIRPQNLLTFSINPFATLVSNIKVKPKVTIFTNIFNYFFSFRYSQ